MSGLQALVSNAFPLSLSLSKAQLGHFDTETGEPASPHFDFRPRRHQGMGLAFAGES
jgi:hypothetical protein